MGYWSEIKRGAWDQRQWGARKDLLDIGLQVLAIAAESPGRGGSGKGPALNTWMSSSGDAAHAAGVEIPWEVADLKSQTVPAASRGCKELLPCDFLCSWDLGQCKDI